MRPRDRGGLGTTLAATLRPLRSVPVLVCICLTTLAVAAADADAATRYAYADGTGSPSGCPASTPSSTGCSLTAALSVAGAGDTVKLETAGQSAGGTDFTGHWSIGTAGTSAATPVTIDGGDVTGATLNGTGSGGAVLTVTNNMFLALKNLTIKNGNGPNGAGLSNNNGGSVTVTAVTFTDNSGNDGGAIDNGDRAGGLALGSGSLTITGSTFIGNSAGDGGAIDNGDGDGSGTVTISDSTFTGNAVPGGDGGAVDNADAGGSGTVTITGSTFTGNSSEWGGAVNNGSGGVVAGSLPVSMSIADSTFSGNTATDQGGAVDNAYHNPHPVTMTVSDSTLTGDKAVGIGNEIDTSDNGHGILVVSSSTLDAGGSGRDVVAGANGGIGQVFVAGDVFARGFCQQSGTGTWTDQGYEAGADATCFNGGTGDVNVGSVAALGLGALADNGGPTHTMALHSPGPAVGIIPAGTTATLNSQQVPICPAADQRGDPRPGNGKAACDAGAFESQGSDLYAYAAGASTISGCPLTASAALQCSLTTVLSRVNPGDTVKLETPGQSAGGADFTGHWSVGTADTSAAAAVTIDGGDVTDATLNANGGGTALTVTNNMFLAVQNLTIKNGAGMFGAGLSNNNGGSVAITDVTFAGNIATDGGAIDSADGDGGSGSGSLAITRSTFTGNTASLNGGAIDTGDDGGSGTVTITDSTFAGNTASAYDGGAIDNADDAGAGTVGIVGSTFTGNTATDGGAVDNADGGAGFGTSPISLSIATSTFSGNSAAADGGALDNADQNPKPVAATVSDSTLSGDMATVRGAEIDTSDNGQGILVVSSSTLDAGGSGSDIVAGANTGIGQVFVVGDVFARGCQRPGTGTWTDQGYEAAADASCFNAGSGDVNAGSVAALGLGVLGDNGGPTHTMALLPSGPAVGIIPPGTTATLNSHQVPICPATDQRGDARPGNGKAACDAGAYETQPHAPSTQISAPANGDLYAVGSTVHESFTCSEGTEGPGLASCTDGSGHATGALIDTSKPGSFQLTVTATSKDGFTANDSVHYTVAAPPSVRISSPKLGAAFAAGTVVHSEFACTEGTAGPGISGCTDQSGNPSGTRLDTHTPGPHTLTVTATSKDGLTGTLTVTYSVTSSSSRALRLSRLHVVPRRFHPARSGPSTTPHPGTGTGTIISYADTQPASTRIKILRCTGRRGSCSRQRLIATLTHHDAAGRNTVNFTGRVRNNALSPGRYALQLIASRNRHSSPLILTNFTVLPLGRNGDAPAAGPD